MLALQFSLINYNVLYEKGVMESWKSIIRITQIAVVTALNLPEKKLRGFLSPVWKNHFIGEIQLPNT